MVIWSKHEVIDLVEITLQAWNQAVETISALTGLPAAQVQAQLIAMVAAPWQVRTWKPLTSAVENV